MLHKHGCRRTAMWSLLHIFFSTFSGPLTLKKVDRPTNDLKMVWSPGFCCCFVAAIEDYSKIIEKFVELLWRWQTGNKNGRWQHSQDRMKEILQTDVGRSPWEVAYFTHNSWYNFRISWKCASRRCFFIIYQDKVELLNCWLAFVLICLPTRKQAACLLCYWNMMY